MGKKPNNREESHKGSKTSSNTPKPNPKTTQKLVMLAEAKCINPETTHRSHMGLHNKPKLTSLFPKYPKYLT
jgi:hypothetical protein